MKDKSSDDDYRDGNDSAPQPFTRIDKEAGNHYRESDFGKD
jgi:hypothetical protein